MEQEFITPDAEIPGLADALDKRGAVKMVAELTEEVRPSSPLRSSPRLLTRSTPPPSGGGGWVHTSGCPFPPPLNPPRLP